MENLLNVWIWHICWSKSNILCLAFLLLLSRVQPSEYYTARIEQLQKHLAHLKQKSRSLGVFRFLDILILFAAIYFLWPLGLIYVILTALALLIIFFRLVLTDQANKEAVQYTRYLLSINEGELKATEGEFLQFGDGSQYNPKEHYYANDLDIFGRASLFQFLNRTTSEPGGSTLANWLLNPSDADTLRQRQCAVRELSTLNEWRQELQATGRETSIQFSTLHRLVNWCSQKPFFSHFSSWRWLRYVLPAIILSVTALTIFDFVSMGILLIFLFAYAVIAFFINKKVVLVHNQLSKIVEEVDVLSNSIRLIEQAIVKSELLVNLQSEFGAADRKASAVLRQLKIFLDRLDMRYNIVLAAPLNLFLLWDLQQVLNLEEWKKINGAHIPKWFTALGEIEALNSIATIIYNNTDWCFPELVTGNFEMKGKELGHPLISKKKRVNNPVDVNHKGELMLVTGSNMAGKSTYLRSIGINTVLAMAGSPVCAESFTLSPVQIISSMRIADNLEESTSTFYAELKKLKVIIEKVNRNESVFILLDEILRGTNSLDRHTGSVALIKQLIKHKAVGIIATHDIKLADLKTEYPDNILSYHFDVQVNNEELFFDYRLKEGVCTSLNATILMKKIGIEIN